MKTSTTLLWILAASSGLVSGRAVPSERDIAARGEQHARLSALDAALDAFRLKRRQQIPGLNQLPGGDLIAGLLGQGNNAAKPAAGTPANAIVGKGKRAAKNDGNAGGGTTPTQPIRGVAPPAGAVPTGTKDKDKAKGKGNGAAKGTGILPPPGAVPTGAKGKRNGKGVAKGTGILPPPGAVPTGKGKGAKGTGVLPPPGAVPTGKGKGVDPPPVVAAPTFPPFTGAPVVNVPGGPGGNRAAAPSPTPTPAPQRPAQTPAPEQPGATPEQPGATPAPGA